MTTTTRPSTPLTGNGGDPARRRPRSLRSLAEAVERASSLDAAGSTAAGVARKVFPEGSAARDVLGGAWLGHAVHPLLTDVVIGSWLSASIVDLAGGRRRDAADILVAAGIVSYLPTAVAGASDWSMAEEGNERVRRLGLAHSLINHTALGLQVWSLAARRRGRRGRGVAVSLLANGVTGVGGFLGGHLAYVRGVGVEG